MSRGGKILWGTLAVSVLGAAALPNCAKAQSDAAVEPTSRGKVRLDDRPDVVLANVSANGLPLVTSGRLASGIDDQLGRPPAVAATANEQLVLAASVNGTATDQLILITRAPDGSLSSLAGELRRLRIKVPAQASALDRVDFADLPGLVASIDEPNQSISLRAPDALMVPWQVGLAGNQVPVDIDRIKPLPGGLLNYSISAWVGAGDTSVTGNVEAIAMTGHGALSTTAVFDSIARYGRGHATRLDTNWRFIDPVHIRSITLGDFISTALSWTSSVRLAGIQIASAFDQRPDLVTNALPQFSGSAVLPSALDLYINQQRIYSGEIPSGPFELKSLPYTSGGEVRLVTTDANGRQLEIKKSYYYVAGQLKKGIFQYSLDIGVPRLNYATDSFDYDTTVFGSGSFRYGLTDAYTLQGRIEGTADGLANGGLGIVHTVGGRGAVSASLAAGRYRSSFGGKAAVQIEGTLAGVRAFVGTERTVGDYMDLGRVAEIRQAERITRSAATVTAADWLNATARASIIDRAGLSFTPWFDRVGVNISYNRIKAPTYDQRLVNLTVTRSLGHRVSMFVSSFKDVDQKSNFGLFATLTVQFARGMNGSVGIDQSNGRTGYTAELSGTADQRQNSLSWGITDREYRDADSQRSAFASYRAPQAQMRAQVDAVGDAVRGSMEIDGSVVAAGGGVFLANQIGQAFAIVKNAGPGVDISQNHVPMAKADHTGSALLPNLQPFDQTAFTVDPTNLPDGWELPTTEVSSAAGYKQGVIVDFGAKKVRAAILTLHDPQGKPVPPGYTATLDGGVSSQVGYDGQVYLTGLNAINHLTVDLNAAGSCSVTFKYDIAIVGQGKIGPLTCQ